MSDSQIFGSEVYTENHDFLVTAVGLEETAKYYYRYLLWNPNYVNDKFKMEVKTFTTKANVPKVRTVEVTDVARTTATIIGEVTDESGAAVTERGVCWDVTPIPSTSGNHLNSGTGTGTFSVALSDLAVGQKYYVRAYAINEKGTAYGDTLSFITGDAVKPTVTTAGITNIDWRTATGGGEVTNDGDATVTERGICWSTEHDPEIGDGHTSNGTGLGHFDADLSGLTAGTTYYVRAYAKNQAGIGYGNEVTFETRSPELPTVTTSAVIDISSTTAKGGGNVTSDGGVDVTDRGICWSTNPNPEITDSHASNGTGMGTFTVNMSGLTEGMTYYVRAYATNSKGTSYGDEKTFSPFDPGVIKAKFSVSESEQVYFSQGNLQYRASTDTWRFAEHQYDIVSSSNCNISSTYDSWIDLFGWGTSGYNNKYPYMTSTNFNDYGDGNNDIAGTLYDWGVHNAISNGGDQAGLWRTLTKDEWVYVFDTRNTSSGIRYARACVNLKNGVILLPDDWSASYYSLSYTNNSGASYSNNTISAFQWTTLEQHGAVFLPATGYRYETSINSVGSYGGYWSASSGGSSSYAYDVSFYDSDLDPQNYGFRREGKSVRLVRNAQ